MEYQESNEVGRVFYDLLAKWVERRRDNENISYAVIARDSSLTEGALSQLRHRKKKPTMDSAKSLAKGLKLNSEEREQFLTAASELINESKQNKKIQNLDGIIKVHHGLPDGELNNAISKAGKRIWILESWVVNPLRYKESFINVAKNMGETNSLTIRALLLDSKSDLAAQRSRELWLEPDEHSDRAKKVARVVPQMINASIDEFNLLRELTGVELAIRKNKFMPPFSAYICDNVAFIGFFLHKTQSDTAPQLEVALSLDNNMTPLGKIVIQEFNTLWDIAEPMNTNLNLSSEYEI